MPKLLDGIASFGRASLCAGLALGVMSGACAAQQAASTPIVLHAARLLDVRGGSVISPGEVLVEGERIRAVGKSVDHPQGAKVIDLGDTTLMPGLIARISTSSFIRARKIYRPLKSRCRGE